MPTCHRWLAAIGCIAAMSRPSHAQQQPAPSADLALKVRAADSLFAAHAYGRAVVAYDELARLDSTDSRYWFQLGMSAAQTGDYATGARAFARASGLRAGPAATYNAGAMHARLGHADSAFAWLQRAVQSGFNDSTTLKTDDDLASLRGDARFGTLLRSMTEAPAPCRNAPENRRFDFWVGNWKVTTVDGTQVGTSHVDVVSGGCALLENWRDRRGGEGKSLNTFDPALHMWRQFWVGQGGAVTDYARSEWRDTTLSFFVDFPSRNGGPAAVMRLSFTPLDPDVVRQHSELSTDGGKTWTTQYDFRYHRIK